MLVYNHRERKNPLHHTNTFTGGKKIMDNVKKISISEIERIKTLAGFKNFCLINDLNYEVIDFKKEFQLVFANVGGYFGYSVFVFKNNRHLYYANDYELHHPGKTQEELKKWYFEVLDHKVFSDAELLQPTPDYITQEKKDHYLRNYWIQQFDYISAFNIFHNDKEKEDFLKSVEEMYYNRFSFCYVSDKNIIDRQETLFKGMKDANEKAKETFEYWFEAFKYEMFNHEFVINWQADYDVISCFARVPYSENREKLLNAAGFTDLQKDAYRKAVSYVDRHSDY